MAHLVLPNSHGHGWKPDTPDYRDHYLSTLIKAPKRITGPVALKAEFLPPVRDQGQLGSCTGFGATGALMYKLRERKREVQLSALYAYYQARVVEGSVAEDAGAEIRDVIKQAAKVGVALEKCWPYNSRKFSKTPTKTATNSAQAHQVARYYRCDDPSGGDRAKTVEMILSALVSDLPVVFGFACYANLDDGRDGHIPMPRGALEGGHCVWIVGADPATREFKFQNSWAADWGDKGYGYLPFDYVIRGLADDAWAIDHE
jgi:C1A family cysteine protease